MKKMSLSSPGSIPWTAKWKDAALSAQIEKDAWFSPCGIIIQSLLICISLDFRFH